MFALGFSAALLIFWGLVGQALFLVSGNLPGVLRSWLLAPALGLAVTVLGVMTLNQSGLPVDRFAWPLALTLAALAVAVVMRRRPAFPLRSAVPFLAATAGFLLLEGCPFLHVGFHWIAYANDDYLNYCLAADRMRRFGFFHVPTLADLSGRDYPQYFWFMHVASLMRFGAEELVAWTASILDIRTMFSFMPAQLAAALAQILAAAGLVLHRGRWRRAAQATAILLAVAPMFVFGYVYQLIAQVGGLALLLAFVATACRRWSQATPRAAALRGALPPAVAGSALAIFYPEVTPFAGIAVAIFVLRDVLARRSLRPWLTFGSGVVGGAVILLRYNLLSYSYTLLNQFNHGIVMRGLVQSRFPFFLLPSGLSALFGFHPLPALLPEPWGSVFIAMGAVLLLAAGAGALIMAWRREPIGGLLLVCLAMWVVLFRQANDFGLYKLSMYLQPALLGVLAWVWARGTRFRAARAALGVAYVAWVFPVGWRYVRTSLQREGALINELMNGSARDAHMPALAAGRGIWTAGLDNVAAAKYTASRYPGTDVRFLDMDYFGRLFHLDSPINEHSPGMWLYPGRDSFAQARSLWIQLHRGGMYRKASIFGSQFLEASLPGGVAGYLEFPADYGLFNKAPAQRPDSGRLLDAVGADRSRNVAFFVDSSRGELYFQGDPTHIGLFQREYDPWFREGGIYALGRFLLIRVERCSPEVYVRVEASKTNKGRGNTHWPGRAVVWGREAAPLPFVGDGAGNVYAGPVRPRVLDGAAYLAIDFGEPGTLFPNHRTGLNRLYRANIPLDYRLTVAFGRDISVLDPRDYAALARPRSFSPRAPDAFRQPGFEYSGLYEDGWASGSAYVTLAAPARGEALCVQGFVPQIGRPHIVHLACSIDGMALPALAVAPGGFNWIVPIPRKASGLPFTRFRLQCPDPPRMPGEDGRPVTIMLASARLASAPSEYRFDGAGSEMPFEQGIDIDGWAAQRAELAVAGPAAARAALEIDSPQWTADSPRPVLSIVVDGKAAPRVRLVPGPNRVEVALEPGRDMHDIEIEASETLRIPGADGRVRSYRLSGLSLLPGKVEEKAE